MRLFLGFWVACPFSLRLPCPFLYCSACFISQRFPLGPFSPPPCSVFCPSRGSRFSNGGCADVGSASSEEVISTALYPFMPRSRERGLRSFLQHKKQPPTNR